MFYHRLSYLLPVGFLAAVGVLAPNPAVAEVTVENRTDKTVHVALVYSFVVVDPVFGSGSGVQWSEGWFDVEPGQTRKITSQQAPDRAPKYYYAASESLRWTGEEHTDWVLPRHTFKIRHPITDDAAREKGYEKRGFKPVRGRAITLTP